MNINRRPVTLRLNRQEQLDVASLIEFFTKPGMRPTEKDIFKIALSMLLDSRDTLNRKQAIDAAKAQEQQCEPTVTSPDTSSPVSLEFSAGEPSPAA